MGLCKHTSEWGVTINSTIRRQAKDRVIQFLQQLKTIKVVQKDT